MVGDLVAALDKEQGEFVRPSLVRALAAHGAVYDDPRSDRPCSGKSDAAKIISGAPSSRRSATTRRSTPTTRSSRLRSWTARSRTMRRWRSERSGTSARSRRSRRCSRRRPVSRNRPIATAICVLGVNCGSHQNYLIETLKFADRNLGFQELLRGAATGLGALAVAGGHDQAVDALFEVGIPSQDDSTRAPVSLALGTVALRNTPLMLSVLGKHPDRDRAIELVAEGFDMLEEDLDKETFFAATRRTYWDSPEGSPTRELDADPDRKAGLLMDYRQAGVDIDAGNETVRRIRSLARATFTPGVLSDIGSFGGLFRLDRDRFQDPVLVSSADGVGTKLKVAFMTGRHDTDWRRSRESLRQRHSRPGRRAVVLPRLPRDGTAVPGCRRAGRRRRRAGLPGERVRA